jgi:hypothetical protein
VLVLIKRISFDSAVPAPKILLLPNTVGAVHGKVLSPKAVKSRAALVKLGCGPHQREVNTALADNLEGLRVITRRQSAYGALNACA